MEEISGVKMLRGGWGWGEEQSRETETEKDLPC